MFIYPPFVAPGSIPERVWIDDPQTAYLNARIKHLEAQVSRLELIADSLGYSQFMKGTNGTQPSQQ